MIIDCPYGYLEKVEVGTITLVYTDVTIYGDVCDRCEPCKNKTCKFYDPTKEGTQRYIAGMRKAKGSIEGLITDQLKEQRFRGV